MADGCAQGVLSNWPFVQKESKAAHLAEVARAGVKDASAAVVLEYCDQAFFAKRRARGE